MSEPLSMNSTAVMIHELYTSFITAGFNESQAMELVKQMLPNPNRGE